MRAHRLRLCRRTTAAPTTKATHLFSASFIHQWLLQGGSMESLEQACFRGGAVPEVCVCVCVCDFFVVTKTRNTETRFVAETRYRAWLYDISEQEKICACQCTRVEKTDQL